MHCKILFKTDEKYMILFTHVHCTRNRSKSVAAKQEVIDCSGLTSVPLCLYPQEFTNSEQFQQAGPCKCQSLAYGCHHAPQQQDRQTVAGHLQHVVVHSPASI